MPDENANLEKRKPSKTTTFVDNHNDDNVKKRFESNVDHNINDDDGGSGDSNDTITDNHHDDDDDHNDKRNDINNDNDHEINNNNFDEKIRIAMAKIHEANIRKVK